MNRFVSVFAFAAAVSLMLLPAVAASAPPLASQAPRVPVRQGTSTNWSGYAVETNLSTPQSYAVTDVIGTWTVPQVTSSSTNTYSSVWVGIDGYSDGTVEQLGTEQDWVNGQPRYYAWIEMYPKLPSTINYPIAYGDTITAEVTYTGNNQFVLSMTDTPATGAAWTFSTKARAKAQRQSAEWIVEAPWSGGVLPLANFGTVKVTGAQATLNTATGAINNPAWQNDPITMETSSGVLKAVPSALSPDGSSFTVTWQHN